MTMLVTDDSTDKDGTIRADDTIQSDQTDNTRSINHTKDNSNNDAPDTLRTGDIINDFDSSKVTNDDDLLRTRQTSEVKLAESEFAVLKAQYELDEIFRENCALKDEITNLKADVQDWKHQKTRSDIAYGELMQQFMDRDGNLPERSTSPYSPPSVDLNGPSRPPISAQSVAGRRFEGTSSYIRRAAQPLGTVQQLGALTTRHLPEGNERLGTLTGTELIQPAWMSQDWREERLRNLREMGGDPSLDTGRYPRRWPSSVDLRTAVVGTSTLINTSQQRDRNRAGWPLGSSRPS